MLLQLRDVIAKERWVSVQQLARIVRVAPDALGPMLNRWETLGVIKRHDAKGCQSACGGCRPSTDTMAIYEWLGSSGSGSNSRGPGMA